MTDYIKTIHKSKLFHRIPEEQLDDLLERLDSQLKFYRRDQVAIIPGRRVRRVGLILEGEMRLYETDFWDREYQVDRLRGGSLLMENNAVSGSVTIHKVKAAENSVVLWFNAREMLTLDESNPSKSMIIQSFMRELAKKNLGLYARLSDMDQVTTKEKLLSFLSKEALRHNSDEFDIPFDRQELADYLSVERSAMSAELSKLAKEGYLETKKNHFRLFRQPKATS